MKKNIVLIGMPAVGKSTIGVVVAKRLGYDFIDTDLLIQSREKRLLKEIIKDEDSTNCASVTLYTLSFSETLIPAHTAISGSPASHVGPLSPLPSPCLSGVGAQRKGVSGWAWEACVQRG